MKTATDVSIQLISSNFFSSISSIGVFICGSKTGDRKQTTDEELKLKEDNTENNNRNVM